MPAWIEFNSVWTGLFMFTGICSAMKAWSADQCTCIHVMHTLFQQYTWSVQQVVYTFGGFGRGGGGREWEAGLTRPAQWEAGLTRRLIQ